MPIYHQARDWAKRGAISGLCLELPRIASSQVSRKDVGVGITTDSLDLPATHTHTQCFILCLNSQSGLGGASLHFQRWGSQGPKRVSSRSISKCLTLLHIVPNIVTKCTVVPYQNICCCSIWGRYWDKGWEQISQISQSFTNRAHCKMEALFSAWPFLLLSALFPSLTCMFLSLG